MNKVLDIKSASELINNPVPNIKYRILGLLRANGGRMSLTGQYKSEKSLLAQDLAFKIAAGQDWLGFKTLQGRVLYINLEISEEKFQERTQDFNNKYNYDDETQQRFMEVTLLDRNLSLDLSTDQIAGLLKHCQNNDSKIDVLIIDPRARAITASENEEVVIKRFCDNVDSLLSDNPGLSAIIITHMGKDSSKGAIGHSRFSGWLDTEIKISKSEKVHEKILNIIGRDTEKAVIPVNFKYPIHELAPEEKTIRQSKVGEAIKFIKSSLSDGAKPEQQLRADARAKEITDYAFHTAIRELKDDRIIITVKAVGQGNRKLLKLADNPTKQ
jgi:hypothetical protein